MMDRGRTHDEYFDCPHCGAPVPVGAAACRECGSDDETGWSEDAGLWDPEIWAGSVVDDDFDYDEFVSREFPESSNVPVQQLVKKWAMFAIVAILCMGLLLLAVRW